MAHELASNAQEKNENPYDISVVLTANELFPEFQRGRLRERTRDDIFCNRPLEVSGGIDSHGIIHGRIRTWPFNSTTFKALTNAQSNGKGRLELLKGEQDILDFHKEAKKIEGLTGPDPLESIMGKLYTFGRARNTFLTDSTIDRSFRGPFEPRAGRELIDTQLETQFTRDIAQTIRDNRQLLSKDLTGASNTQILREFEMIKTPNGRREILTLYLNMYDEETQKELITRYMEDYKGMKVLYQGDDTVGFAQLPESDTMINDEDGSLTYISGDSLYSIKATEEGFDIDCDNLPWFTADLAWSLDRTNNGNERLLEKTNGSEIKDAVVNSKSGNFTFRTDIPARNSSALMGLVLADYFICVQTGLIGRGIRQKDILKDVYARRKQILQSSIIKAAERAVIR